MCPERIVRKKKKFVNVRKTVEEREMDAAGIIIVYVSVMAAVNHR